MQVRKLKRGGLQKGPSLFYYGSLTESNAEEKKG
jgi:hypothetical protein